MSALGSNLGDITATRLTETVLTCCTCARPLAGCTCTVMELRSAVRMGVRGTLIDGRPAVDLIGGAS